MPYVGYHVRSPQVASSAALEEFITLLTRDPRATDSLLRILMHSLQQFSLAYLFLVSALSIIPVTGEFVRPP